MIAQLADMTNDAKLAIMIADRNSFLACRKWQKAFAFYFAPSDVIVASATVDVVLGDANVQYEARLRS